MGEQEVTLAIAQKSSRFHQLDAVRGLAALAVVLSHFVAVMDSDPVFGIPALTKMLGQIKVSPAGGMLLGLPAVLLFFVLSGFALTKMLQGSKDGYGGYVVKRIARIWPPYLVSILLCVTLVAVAGWPTGVHVGGWLDHVTGHPVIMSDLIDHVLLLGAFETHYNFVAWTLVYEMRISLMFPLIYASLLRWAPRSVLLFYGGLSVLSVGLHYYAKSHSHPDLANWFATGHYALFFAIGGLIALNDKAISNWYASRSVGMKILLLLVIVMSYTYPSHIRALGGKFSQFPMLLTHWMILPSTFFIVAAAVASTTAKSILIHPSLLWLGKVSYSLYLFHALVLFFVTRFVSDTLGVLPAAILGILLSLIVASLANKWIEIPSQKLGRFMATKL